MNVETVVATAVIAAAITAIRRGAATRAPTVWREATRLEKCGLVVMLLPIPGPVDEIIGALVIARIVRRRRNGR